MPVLGDDRARKRWVNWSVQRGVDPNEEVRQAVELQHDSHRNFGAADLECTGTLLALLQKTASFEDFNRVGPNAIAILFAPAMIDLELRGSADLASRGEASALEEGGRLRDRAMEDAAVIRRLLGLG